MTNPVLPKDIQAELMSKADSDWVNSVVEDLFDFHRNYMAMQTAGVLLLVAPIKPVGPPTITKARDSEIQTDDTLVHHLGKLARYIKETLPTLPEPSVQKFLTWVVTA